MINKEADISMDKICRTCMLEKDDMKDVFESSETIKGDTLKIAEMLMACASVQVIYLLVLKLCFVTVRL